jgi:hypothetical protein
MKTFDQIAIENNADKSSLCHDYMTKYEKHFSKFIDKDINILEIGVASGASLRTWRDIFPKANIYGIDINPLCVQQDSERIKIFIGSQFDKVFLDNVMKEIGHVSVIVDDGSHEMEHMVFTFEVLFPQLSQSGVYALEDLHSCYINMSLPRCLCKNNVIDYFKNKVYDLDFNGNVEGYGNKQIDYNYVKNRIKDFSPTYYEEYIDGISFYKSIIFIDKNNGLLK